MPKAALSQSPPLDAGALQLLLRGTSGATGAGFLRALVRNLAEGLGTAGAWVTEYVPEGRRLRSLAFWLNGAFVEEYEYPVAGTPCADVVSDRCLVHVPDRVVQLYPADQDLADLHAVSYVGVPLLDPEGTVIGHLAALDSKPMPESPSLAPFLELFAERAAAECRRLQAERRIAELGQEAEYLREAARQVTAGGEMLGGSNAMLQVYDAIARVARANTTVLIEGETGTGKELVARAIHRASKRASRPLVRVNCAAVPLSLMESEFFGHERGAFTGATQRREGRFALANGGTIFLDEVGELPLDVQAKLLRVLQEGEFEPLGSSCTVTVDVRVIAATNRDIAAMVREGTFREDLFYRLGVFLIHLPPLRERGNDVAVIAASFAQRLASQMGRHIDPLDPEDVRLLKGYHWPGNVRELQNVVERAIILARGTRLDLARAMPGAELPAPLPAAEEPAAQLSRILTEAEVRAFERRNVIRALEQCGGRVSGDRGAARLLGIAPSTLSSRIKALGIQEGEQARRPRSR